MNVLIELSDGELLLVTPEAMSKIMESAEEFDGFTGVRLVGVVGSAPTGDPKSIQVLEHERLEWAIKTFPEATAMSSIKKCRGELDEIEWDIEGGIKRPEEYADAIMCLFDSAARQGITVDEILEAYAAKIKINKGRKWMKNDDNSYSHVK